MVIILDDTELGTDDIRFLNESNLFVILITRNKDHPWYTNPLIDSPRLNILCDAEGKITEQVRKHTDTIEADAIRRGKSEGKI